MARTTKNVIVPPTLEDAEMDRVIKDIYTILTDIKQSVNVASGEENTAKEGKIGDLRVVKNKASNTYSIEGKTEDGWVSTPANLQSSMTKAGAAVFPTAVISDGSLPAADYESDWTTLSSTTHRYDTSGLTITHNLGSVPRLVQMYCDDGGDEYHSVATSIGFNLAHGLTYQVTSTAIIVHASSSNWSRPSTSSAVFAPTMIKVLLWK